MLTILCLRETQGADRFYRVELAENLFGEYTVLREWGRRGPRAGAGRRVTWFSNLREACLAAEAWALAACGRGYRATLEPAA